ncbi:hypothetical protein IAT38_003062 [Cryptococcus sp. DSM 104549]
MPTTITDADVNAPVEEHTSFALVPHDNSALPPSTPHNFTTLQPLYPVFDTLLYHLGQLSPNKYRLIASGTYQRISPAFHTHIALSPSFMGGLEFLAFGWPRKQASCAQVRSIYISKLGHLRALVRRRHPETGAFPLTGLFPNCERVILSTVATRYPYSSGYIPAHPSQEDARAPFSPARGLLSPLETYIGHPIKELAFVLDQLTHKEIDGITQHLRYQTPQVVTLVIPREADQLRFFGNGSPVGSWPGGIGMRSTSRRGALPLPPPVEIAHAIYWHIRGVVETRRGWRAERGYGPPWPLAEAPGFVEVHYHVRNAEEVRRLLWEKNERATKDMRWQARMRNAMVKICRLYELDNEMLRR